MAVAEAIEPPVAASEPEAAPGFLGLARRHFTVDEVMRMLEAGILGEDEPVELRQGELFLMSPQSPQHAGLTDQLAEVLTECFGQGYRVRLHSPISCGPEDLPEPDIAVVEGARGSFRSRHPEGKELALLVEISSSSRRKDHRKAGLYARWGVDHYWLIDLEQQRLEVHTEPRADGGYGLVHILDPGQRVEVPGTGTELDVSAVLGL